MHQDNIHLGEPHKHFLLPKENYDDLLHCKNFCKNNVFVLVYLSPPSYLHFYLIYIMYFNVNFLTGVA